MWLIHETSLSKLKKILQDGYLKSSRKTDEIYMSVLFNDIQIVGKGEHDDILLVFPIEILKKYDTSHWSPEWLGRYVKGTSIRYDKSKTPKENLDTWNSVFHDVRTKKQDFIYKVRASNEVVFNEKIPISEVSFIYMNNTVKPTFDVPKRVSTKQALNKLLEG